MPLLHSEAPDAPCEKPATSSRAPPPHCDLRYDTRHHSRIRRPLPNAHTVTRHGANLPPGSKSSLDLHTPHKSEPVNTFAHLVLIGFAPAISLLFRALSLQWAVAITVVGGYLYLPILSIPIAGLPDYSKPMAISVALVIGLIIRKGANLRPTSLRWWDVIYLISLLSLPLSYLFNGYPLYNALSALFTRTMIWGVPYWVGRVTYQTPKSVRVLLLCVVIASLTYLPLCLWEVRMSPHLHLQVYGSFQHSFAQMIRWGGYRPMVFTEHGLTLALWMAVALAAAIGLRKTSKDARHWIGNTWWLVPGLMVMLFLCKSLGALALGLTAALALSIHSCRRLLLIAITGAFVYVLGRVFFDEMVYNWIAAFLDILPEGRAASFRFRMDMERLLLARAWEQPVVGFVAEEFRRVSVEGLSAIGSSKVVTDSLWIIVFGTTGLLGLIPLYTVLFVAGTRSCVRRWQSASVEAQVISVIVAIQMLDTVANAAFTPFAILSTGAALAIADHSSPDRVPGIASHKGHKGRIRGRRLLPRTPRDAAEPHQRTTSVRRS